MPTCSLREASPLGVPCRPRRRGTEPTRRKRVDRSGRHECPDRGADRLVIWGALRQCCRYLLGLLQLGRDMQCTGRACGERDRLWQVEQGCVGLARPEQGDLARLRRDALSALQITPFKIMVNNRKLCEGFFRGLGLEDP